ncbi:MAG: hypothetical protein R6V85_08505 [Polyangia bacterium]
MEERTGWTGWTGRTGWTCRTCRTCLILFFLSFSSTAGEPPEAIWLGPNGDPLPEEGALGVWVPESAEQPAAQSPRRFRIAVRAGRERPRTRISVWSVPSGGTRARDRVADLPLVRVEKGMLATPWLVAVSSREDQRAPELEGRALLVRLTDRVEARVRRGGGRARVSARRVARPPGEHHPLSVRRLSVRVTVLRARRGGSPVVGDDERGAREVARHQLAVLNEVLAQCAIWVGPPREADVRVADPPGPSLIAVGGDLGTPSAGGRIRLEVDGRRLDPWHVGSGNTPIETARDIARRLREAGYLAESSANARNPHQAYGTADVVVRRADGTPAELGGWAGEPLSTDPAQPLEIGEVRLEDGLRPYDRRTILSGTVEERALVKLLGSREQNAVDLFLVNRFTGGGKQGESFVRSSGSSLSGVAIADRLALERTRQAYAVPHEIGHVLLDDLGHPDARGDDRPGLLMHSRSSSAVDGPRRITPRQCELMRHCFFLNRNALSNVPHPP